MEPSASVALLVLAGLGAVALLIRRLADWADRQSGLP